MLLRSDQFREVDRFTDGVFGDRDRAPWIPMDAVRRGEAIEVCFDLPGVRPDAIDLIIENDVLTLEAERRRSRDDGAEVITRERPQGRCSRRVLLGEGLDTDAIEAHYEQGVLYIRIPVAENARARKVEVHAEQRPAIDLGADT